MKLPRLLTAAILLFALCVPAAIAGDKAKSEKSCESCCECPKDKEGKTCGVDKDCCCTGKKAEKKEEKKS
jgi:hypothetical protein